MEKQIWEEFLEANESSPITAQWWTNSKLENAKHHEEKVFCCFSMENGMTLAVPVEQMVNIHVTRWSNDNGEPIMIYGEYS